MTYGVRNGGGKFRPSCNLRPHSRQHNTSAQRSFALGLTFIPASITGWLIPNSLVSGVENTGFDGGMVVVRLRVLQGSIKCRPSCRITIRCQVLF